MAGFDPLHYLQFNINNFLSSKPGQEVAKTLLGETRPELYKTIQQQVQAHNDIMAKHFAPGAQPAVSKMEPTSAKMTPVQQAVAPMAPQPQTNAPVDFLRAMTPSTQPTNIFDPATPIATTGIRG